MKLTWLFWAYLVLGTSALTAAHGGTIPGGVRLAGVKGGVALSGARLDPKPDSSMIVEGGPAVGFFYVHPLTGRFALQPELNYHRKGFSLMKDFGAYKDETKFTFHYLDVPILLRVSPFLDRAFKVLVGPVPSYLLDARANIKVGSVETSMDYTGQMKRFDLGMAVGLGGQFARGFNMEARYTHGLLDVSRVPGQDLKNWSLALTVGWAFRLP